MEAGQPNEAITKREQVLPVKRQTIEAIETEAQELLLEILEGASEGEEVSDVNTKQELPGCLATILYPSGIPIWKSFAFHFWGSPQTPLGPLWTLGPNYVTQRGEGSEDNQYIGYSIEKQCRASLATIPQPREHQALLLGKHMNYFEGDYYAYPGMLEGVSRSIAPTTNDQGVSQNFSFVTTVKLDEGTEFPEGGVEVVHTQDKAEWINLLGSSKALVCGG